MYLLDYIDNNLLLLASVWYASFCLGPLFLWSRWMIEEGYFSQEITNDSKFRIIVQFSAFFAIFLFSRLFIFDRIVKKFLLHQHDSFFFNRFFNRFALFLFSFSYLELSLSILPLRHMFIRMIDISWWM